MNGFDGIERIKRKFAETGSPARVPLLRGGGSFTAELARDGIIVDNLGNQPFLPWIVFQEVVRLLQRSGGRAERGNAMNFKLGESGLPFDSVEGHIAHVVYRKSKGVAITRRITPIACILIWAGVCKANPGELILIS